MIKYSLRINSLPQSTEIINGFSQVVISANYNLVGVDGEYQFDVNRPCLMLPIPPECDPDFIPYESLTVEIVNSWIEQGDKEWILAQQKVIRDQVELQKNPPVIDEPLPWASKE